MDPVPTPKTKLEIVFGAMTFGKEGTSPPLALPLLSNPPHTLPGEEQVRTSDLPTCAAILSAFQSHGHSELDTSRFYGSGTSETHLRALSWQSRGLTIGTKYYPNVNGIMGRPVSHLDAASLRAGLLASLEALGCERVDLWYLHGPDRSIPLEETLAEVDKLHKEGRFLRWGVSNFMAWEVAAICELCAQHGWTPPSVYQGVYNALHRTVEHELLPCLRAYNLAFYAFNPLAGGFLSDRYHRDTSDAEVEPGCKFDTGRMQGRMYRARYWNEANFEALEGLREAAGREGVRESEAALRWLVHHSELRRERGDKIIIGASSVEQCEGNLRDLEGGPLGEGVRRALDVGWEKCRGGAWKYFH